MQQLLTRKLENLQRGNEARNVTKLRRLSIIDYNTEQHCTLLLQVAVSPVLPAPPHTVAADCDREGNSTGSHNPVELPA